MLKWVLLKLIKNWIINKKIKVINILLRLFFSIINILYLLYLLKNKKIWYIIKMKLSVYIY